MTFQSEGEGEGEVIENLSNILRPNLCSRDLVTAQETVEKYLTYYVKLIEILSI